METQAYEVVIVGTGEGSKYLVWTLGKQGKRVAAVERKYLGGACPNIACLPTKNIIHSKRSEEFGITKEDYKVDMAAVRDRKRKMVAGLVDIHVANFKASGAELIMGSAKFTGPKTLDERDDQALSRRQGTHGGRRGENASCLDQVSSIAGCALGSALFEY